MTQKTPATNVHSEDILSRVVKVLTPEYDIKSLCDLGNEIQASLRSAKCDSPRIANDPAFRIFMIEMGQRCDVNIFSNYIDCVDLVEKNIAGNVPASKRSQWAEMAQSGAVNLTPLMRSLGTAVEQVISEGAIPHDDAAVRLISHQMSYLTATNSLKRDDLESKNLVSWCDAQRALLSINNVLKPTNSPSL